MAINDDFTISPTGDIRHVEADNMERREFWDTLYDNGFVDHDSETEFGPLPGTYTVLEFHRWLQDLADEPMTADSVIDILSPVPSLGSTDNLITLTDSYSIDDKSVKILDGGTLATKNGIYTSIKNI